MNATTTLHGLAALALIALAHSAAAAAPARNLDWPLHGLDSGNHRLAAITAINPKTVGKLVPKWIYQSGVNGTFQATPIVVDGRMYVSLPGAHVVALDARTGRELWRYEHVKRVEKICCGPANRGVAVAKGRVFVGTVDARLIALDAATGNLLWDVEVARNDRVEETVAGLAASDQLKGQKVSGASGVGLAAAPLVFEDRVIVGANGLGYGLHLDSSRPGAPLGAVVGLPGAFGGVGFLAAFDVATGKPVWRFDTIAKPEDGGWEGGFSATAADGVPLSRDLAAERAIADSRRDAWKSGGGSIYSTPTVDVATGTLYFGVGNPSPQMNGDGRPGDNLYTSSLVAIDGRTGQRRWHWQQVPHDLWGYDVASPPVLIDLTVGGKRVAAVAQASKLGWMFVHDRADGRLLYKSAAFVPQSNLFAQPTREGVTIAPGIGGGVNWSPTAVDEKRGLAFVAAMHWPTTYTVKEIPAADGKPAVPYFAAEPAQAERWGVLAAVDLKRDGKLAWTTQTPQPLVGGVLALTGGVVFTGEGDGNLSAFDSATGKRLWQFNCGAGANAPPIAYVIDGKPYITVAAGGSAIWGYRQGDAVVTFGLPD
ncbi:PQQ-binding-like beta-propeller repeat protein [Nevskia sp.]|uniref:pyrroloquinoline quinone-dependent dehydrogenase n=1 Tax=Nevskia sp. TaxID=1929292 RepID=UPI0025FBFAF6|nr:PQQ-binding-like beta-propeller repeat protein [Nevskia sp.]